YMSIPQLRFARHAIPKAFTGSRALASCRTSRASAARTRRPRRQSSCLMAEKSDRKSSPRRCSRCSSSGHLFDACWARPVDDATNIRWQTEGVLPWDRRSRRHPRAAKLHLNEIATKITPGAHAILLLDQAGWHGAKALKVPSKHLALAAAPRAPELNGQQNIWQFRRQNWLSNRIFKSFDDIVNHCCLEHAHRSAEKLCPLLPRYIASKDKLWRFSSNGLRCGGTARGD